MGILGMLGVGGGVATIGGGGITGGVTGFGQRGVKGVEEVWVLGGSIDCLAALA
jgi:hypothetical protein